MRRAISRSLLASFPFQPFHNYYIRSVCVANFFFGAVTWWFTTRRIVWKLKLLCVCVCGLNFCHFYTLVSVCAEMCNGKFNWKWIKKFISRFKVFTLNSCRIETHYWARAFYRQFKYEFFSVTKIFYRFWGYV